MSVDETPVDPVSTATDSGPLALRSANYMPCRHCEEGALVYDPELEASRCRACGELD
ncbi:MAG: hypothetical protein ABEJ30_06115 [Halorientalis sp.]